MMSALPLELKPEVVPVNFDGIPASLRNHPHWVLWRFEQTENGKWTKPPYQVSGRYAKPDDPATWATFDEVRAAYQAGDFDGIGINLRDDLVGVDLDHVLDASGELEPLAAEIVGRFHGTYMEKSPSGDGLHILTYGTFGRFGKGTEHKNFECYGEDSKRYFTVTGYELSDGADITDQPKALDWLYRAHFNKSTAADANVAQKTDSGAANVAQKTDSGVAKILDDAVILADAVKAGSGERFRKLFDDGDYSDYPSQSEADLALANMLARFTLDSGQLDRLFQVSALFRPEKWNKPHSGDGKTYGQMTIEKALSGQNAGTGIQTAGKTSTDSPHNYEFVRASDFMGETTKTEWLIDGVLEQNTTCMLFGASGSGKSFVAMDWACCVATGTDWHDQEVESAPVFYIVGEGLNGFRRRLKVWEKINGVSLEGKPFHLLKHPVPLSDRDSARDLSNAIAGLVSNEKPCMIIIDTLARNFGDGDENSNSEVNRLMSNIDTHLRIPFNASVVLVHHSGNNEKDRARGASALKAAMDHEYRVDRRSSGDRVLQCTKMKDGPEDFEFHFQIENVFLGGDESAGAGALIPLDEQTNKNGTGEKLRKPVKTCLQVLMDITDPFGVPPSPELVKAEGMFAPALVVHEDKWMPAAIDAGISKGVPASQKKAFDRAVDQLVRANLVGKHGDYYWAKR
ncbi:phage NrS-1 polymerase family protein [Ralstonia sp. 22111]|uniref:phage NrS-1 polymerase family protein n=1 Tax=Ralstonia sp. 22111 TaxID=3453878 RepID=UPI003F866AD0